MDTLFARFSKRQFILTLYVSLSSVAIVILCTVSLCLKLNDNYRIERRRIERMVNIRFQGFESMVVTVSSCCISIMKSSLKLLSINWTVPVWGMFQASYFWSWIVYTLNRIKSNSVSSEERERELKRNRTNFSNFSAM